VSTFSFFSLLARAAHQIRTECAARVQ
jgi:hypothetical protein